MFELYQKDTAAQNQDVPDLQEVISYLQRDEALYVRDVLKSAKEDGRMLVQPRCGVGGHAEMKSLLAQIDAGAPDILTLTIDAHTRLGHFATASDVLAKAPNELNGYPLISHGWQKGRELVESVSKPIEIRHGSPDGRVLFGASIASGATSYEGGGIGYNLPYCKDVLPRDSLAHWREVDLMCGELAKNNILIDRELFGTLTAVLMPPCISLATTFAEALLAVEAGVRCLSIAIPQTGNYAQDVAALYALRGLAEHYLPSDVEVYPVLHQFMGAFPKERENADALIAYSSLTGRAGGAVKIINKTYQEALGIPSVEANVQGIAMTRMATSWIWDLLPINHDEVEEECYWIEREVREMIDPLLSGGDLMENVISAIECGRLDIPFSASIHARSDVLAARASNGSIRMMRFGNLPFSDQVIKRHTRLLKSKTPENNIATDSLFHRVRKDILYFVNTPELNEANSSALS